MPIAIQRDSQPGSSVSGGLELVVFLGSDTLVFPLPFEGTVKIGRAAESDILIEDASISRRHAQFLMDKEIWLEDLDSANGTALRKASAPETMETDQAAPCRGGAFLVGVGDVILLGSVRACIRRAKSRPGAMASKDKRAAVSSPIVVDPLMQALYSDAERAAQSDLPILLLGETGVGKDVLARHIHQSSRYAAGRLVVVHLAAMSASLLESELFGHEKGAFTGAMEARSGLLEAADHGTVFLDEIGEIPLSLQVKLLRVLEDGEIMRIGSRKTKPIDVRFIAATHRDLEAEVRQGTFRQDLYYRINGLTLTVPALRQRRGDIRPLAVALLSAACRRLERRLVPELSERLLWVLERYSFPGNVRELRNMMDRIAALCEESVAHVEHLPSEVVASVMQAESLKGTKSGLREGQALPGNMGSHVSATDFRSAVGDMDRRRILDALSACGGNQTKAAEMLGMSRRTLVARLDEYGLPRPRKNG